MDFELPELDHNQRLGRYVVNTYEKETVRAFVPTANLFSMGG